MASESVAAAADRQADEKQVGETSSEEELPPLVQTWEESVEAIKKGIRHAFPNSPAFDAADPSSFQSYWRQVFTELRSSMESDSTIPNHLTSPSTAIFEIRLQKSEHSGECPCCLPQKEPEIVLRNDNGVTKGDLVIGLVDYLYNEQSTDVASDTNSKGAKRFARQGKVILDFNWMSAPEEIDGRNIAFVNEELRIPEIFVYCGKPQAYKAKFGST